MSSILTNMSAMSAVSSLNSTQKALASTQAQISTGLRVGSAQDNASYWSIATSMRSDIGALGAVGDAINLGTSVVSTASQAVSSSIGILNQMKDLVVNAATAGQNNATIDTQLKQLQDQLRAFSNTATFNGVNLLATPSTTVATNVVTSFSKTAAGIVTIGTTSIGLGTSPLYSVNGGSQGSTLGGGGVLDTVAVGGTLGSGSGFSIDNMVTSVGGTAASSAVLSAEQNEIEAAITSLTTVASTLGSVLSNLTAQGTFTKTLSDSLTSGVGSLVDADMNQASTRLNALQTQQQLGIQSLSIANSNTQLILKLFQ